ncbi:MAG: hypothetical protein ACYDCF_03210 [Burkholderiales bacterium]|nr:hypothetical protein [Ferrovum sp.]
MNFSGAADWSSMCALVLGLRVSRIMGWAVSLLSFLMAALALTRWVAP